MKQQPLPPRKQQHQVRSRFPGKPTLPISVVVTLFCLDYQATGARKIAVASSAPKGTVLKGINYMNEGKDPVALDDNEYPEWLWDLLDEKKQKQKSSKPANRQYHRKQNRDAIRGSNFMKDKKT